MTDADVGKLWEDVYLRRDCPEVEALILKLVEERAFILRTAKKYEKACESFGIPFPEYETAIRQAKEEIKK